mgnify:CR=1 FL=1|jgi:hypothetical protein
MKTKAPAPAPAPVNKIKDEDSEDRLAVVSTFVRLGILIWSGGILTLAYIKLPPALGIPEQKLDPTFIASVFTGVLATFGVQTAKKNGNGNGNGNGENGGISKAEMQKLINAAAQNSPAQTTKIEQDPAKAKAGEPPVVPPTS